MAYTLIEQYSRDIDWYFIDRNDRLVHVASAGGRLPKSIEPMDEIINTVHAEILDLPAIGDYNLNPNIDQIIGFESQELRTFYLSDFIEMAKRGLISIDKTILGNFEDPQYHLVAWPKDESSLALFFPRFESLIKVSKLLSTEIHVSFDLFQIFQ